MSLAPTDNSLDAPTLAMAGAHLTLPETHAGELVVDLAISAGELAIIAASDIHHADQIIDVICGLQMPRSGSVRFQGRDWRNVPNDHANARRGRIGSALGEGAWLPYLSMPDNILLPRLFHTQVPRDELLREAVHLAQQLGLLGLPAGLPAQCSTAERRCAALIRAFLGTPDLVLVGPWAGDLADAALGRLINTMRQAREAGSAIVWFVPEDRRELDVVLLDCRRYTLLGNRLVEDGAA